MSENRVITDDYVIGEMERYKIPGMGISVFLNGEGLLHRGYGYADLEEKRLMTTNSAWGIASCYKAFTSAIIAILVDKGLMEYDKPIIEYLPDFKMDDKVAEKECTIRDMLMHRTGLSENDAIWTDVIDRAELYNRFGYLKSRAPFRTKMIYNNTVYTMAGAIAERVAGISWEEMVREWLFKPIGMTHSRPTFAELLQCEETASAYWNYNGNIKKIPNWNISPGDPCGGIVSTLDDAIKWVEFHKNNGVTVSGERLISERQMNEMHKMQIPTTLWAWNWDGLRPVGGYGLGWFGVCYKGLDVVFHLGEIEGYCTLFAFIPEKKLSYASFVNLHKPCVLPLFSVMYKIFDNVLGLSETDWSGKFGEKIYEYAELHQHWDVNLMSDAIKVEGTSPSHCLDAYEGTYWNDGYGEMCIDSKEGELEAHYRGMVQEMEHFHFDTFVLKNVKEDTIVVTAPLTFMTDPYTGQICGLATDIDPEGETIKFVRRD